jgi:peptidoglycan hydrolase-like protein with peptidoglycan-binding domain
VDGTFGNSTEDAVKQFQKEHKDWDGNALKVDGLVGPETADALNREMVGRWYNLYKTSKDLTIDFLRVTATEERFAEVISIDPKDLEKAKVFLVRIEDGSASNKGYAEDAEIETPLPLQSPSSDDSNSNQTKESDSKQS